MLYATHRAVCATTTSIAIAIGTFTAIDQLSDVPGKLRTGGIGSERTDGGFTPRTFIREIKFSTFVGLHEIGPMADTESDRVLGFGMV